MPHDLGLPWRTDDPYPDVINDSKNDEVASVCSNEDCAFIVKAVNNHAQLVEALTQALDRLEMIAQGRKPNATAFIPQIDAAIEHARAVLASVSAPGESS